MTDEAPSGFRRFGLKARLAMCNWDVPLSQEEQDEQRAWDEMKPVGREWGSPEWLEAEKDPTGQALADLMAGRVRRK
jgi:hypothetical protein